MAQSNGADGEKIIIKKYANRRLYDTSASAYVTLEHLSELTRQGKEFMVQDAKTGQLLPGIDASMGLTIIFAGLIGGILQFAVQGDQPAEIEPDRGDADQPGQPRRVALGQQQRDDDLHQSLVSHAGLADIEQAGAVSEHLFAPGHHVMAEGHWLGDLHVGEARHDGVGLALGEVEQADHGFLGFQAVEQDLDGAEALDLGHVLEQLALAADDEAGGAALAGPGGQAGFHDMGGERVELGAVGGHFLGDDAADVAARNRAKKLALKERSRGG